VYWERSKGVKVSAPTEKGTEMVTDRGSKTMKVISTAKNTAAAVIPDLRDGA
jgi:hypothetical protein